MKTRTRHTGLLTVALGAALVAGLVVWHSQASESPAARPDARTGPRAESAGATQGAPLDPALEAGRLARRMPRTMARKPARHRPPQRLTPAYASARAEALMRWRAELDQRIAPCVAHEGPPSLHAVEFVFAFNAAQSGEAIQHFEVAAVAPEQELDDELAACLRDCTGMSIEVSFDAQVDGYDDFIERVMLPLS